jgi:signal transduction histidine kinase
MARSRQVAVGRGLVRSSSDRICAQARHAEGLERRLRPEYAEDLTWLTAFLAAGIAAGYFTIAAVVLPKIALEGTSGRFKLLFKVGGTTFFVGCGLTHTHIAVHAVTSGELVTWHEIAFHLMQIVGVWAFIYAAVRLIDVRILRRRTPEERQAEELRERVTALSRSNADLEQFAHVVSHDLQEPLRTVAGFATLLRRRYDGQIDDDADEFLRHMTDGCARMGSMLEGVLTYSKVAGAGLERLPVDMNEVLADVH